MMFLCVGIHLSCLCKNVQLSCHWTESIDSNTHYCNLVEKNIRTLVNGQITTHLLGYRSGICGI